MDKDARIRELERAICRIAYHAEFEGCLWEDSMLSSFHTYIEEIMDNLGISYPDDMEEL